MIIDLFTYLFRFILIVLFQLLVINNIELSTYINPYIYIVFILTLPVDMKPWLVVLISFFTGMVMDTFSSTPGLHMASCVFMGYVRIFYLRFATSKEDFSGSIKPTVSRKGVVWFLVYATMLTFLHHLVLFYLEIYGFNEFFRTLTRIIFSTVFSVLLITVGQLLFYRVAKVNRNE
ncbi:MAG: rod shape-determining protein MreD [Bacteroidia bacterium]|nr:rod shape-determining protein MreD [Bacteroidia bacterium]